MNEKIEFALKIATVVLLAIIALELWIVIGQLDDLNHSTQMTLEQVAKEYQFSN